MNILRRAVLAGVFVLTLMATLAWASDDPPGRVARLQYMTGSVSVQPHGTDDWVAGALNRPLTDSDNVWTDKSSKAELNVGGGVFRMDSETSVTLTNVSDTIVQVELHQGSLNLRVRKLFSGETYEVDTPNLAFTVQKSGEYRFDVGPDGDATVVTVRKGEGDATGDGPAVRVSSGEVARFTGGTSLAHDISKAKTYDGFDDWCRVRMQREDSSVSARYVGAGVIGYEDLDDYGYWESAPTYGRIWRPRYVSAGWAPYRYGHWAYISPWGWTWVDDAPWGFAPFHYGRWVYYRNYWAWAPGPIYARPVYAPALVAWFGGPSWGVSIGFGYGGGYGWCPLGWGEPYYPWYGASRGYFRNVNVTNTRIVNITNVTNVYYKNPPNRFGHTNTQYANLKAPNGITAVPRRTLEGGMPVARTNVPVSVRQLNDAPMGGVRDVTPSRNSILGERAGQVANVPPSRTANRPVVTRIAPPSNANRTSGLTASNRPAPGRSVTPTSPTGAQPPQVRGSGLTSATPAPRRVPRPPSADNAASHPSDRGVREPMSRTPGVTTSPAARPTTNPDARNAGDPAPIRRVPRPDAGVTTRSNGADGPRVQNSSPSPMPTNRGSAIGERPVTQARPDGDSASPAPRSQPRTVPHPTGPVMPAPATEARSVARNDRGGNGGRSPSRDYQPSPTYERSSSGAPSRVESPRYESSRTESPRYESPRYEAPRSAAPSSGRESGPAYRGGGNSGGGNAGGGGRSSAPPSRGSGPHLGKR